ncbi:DNA polymerase lambda-like [Asterias rubens]|uniref:DNA polymerase lambda-like n=1 Tax=Asterias rubens TaxID=7604 RepID=UPI001455299E|nr:DNA polymerase lambda-like [Asterias rubens]XP_033633468.1 DNA polymerase lambda-like [Asterias rubens]
MASSQLEDSKASVVRKRKRPTATTTPTVSCNPFLPQEETTELSNISRPTKKSKTSLTSGIGTSKGRSTEPHSKLQLQATPSLNSDETNHQFLNGITAYILQAGLGKARSDIFQKQMSEYGAEVLTGWKEESCTHLIVDEGMDGNRLMRILKLQQPPQNVKVLKASWLSLCLSEKKIVPTDDHEVKFPVTKENNAIKVTAVSTVTSSTLQQNIETLSNKDADLQEVTSNSMPVSQGTKWTSPTKAHTLDRGYDSDDSNYMPSDDDEYQEISVRVSTTSEGTSSTSNTSTPSTSPQKLPKGSWVCSKPSSSQQWNHNQLITDKLEVLMKTYQNTKDHWRSLGYRKAITALKQHPKQVTSWEEANRIPGIGTKLADKIQEIIESGHLRKIDHVCSGDDMKALDLFNNIWGAGPTVAQEWVQLGYRTLDDIREKAKLSRQQKIGLKHYDDFLERMPREEAGAIEATVREMAVSIDPAMMAVVCGSYRRGKTTCGDVDVLVTHPDGKSHRGALGKILDGLRDKGTSG